MSALFLVPQTATHSTQILPLLKSGHLLAIDPQCRGGLIICKNHHAELAGPGAAVGGAFDLTCLKVVPLGDCRFICPNSYEARQQAYRCRQEWLERTQQAMQDAVPLRRAKAILALIAQYFDSQTAESLPDDILAMLVGVFPKTVRMARQLVNKSEESNVKKRRINPTVIAGTSN
ncbi:MAG: hypothetical protein N3E45_07380 [Oscillatoriaceae bacterium SKW80]|nr:hypothetical protein [Oscillatoriaceae bacterium SKYG93]MCX8120637.1 hypothetical protein [Oscillatoriaceae bacterium SKW80]MDW8453824.1 hypothetical protein [Oscillatoriaceae cyanobacterium SKYGB_i_bin93]HIK27055.1 hypothetical protein [Oscillatoriaceae cyanobacterium M7585_C2015_266]